MKNNTNCIYVDLHGLAMGDFVIFCIIYHLNARVGQRILINPSKFMPLTKYLCISKSDITTERRIGFDKALIQFEGEIVKNYKSHKLNRLQAWAKYLGILDLKNSKVPYCNTIENDRWAQKTLKKLGNGKNILLFPNAGWKMRTWPEKYWIDLSKYLMSKNYNVIVVDRDINFLKHFPTFLIANPDYGRLLSLIFLSDLVISNDSGSMHLTGVLGKKGLAICGPTNPDYVFSFYDSIKFTFNRNSCNNCHFDHSKGYYHGCHAGCDSLLSFTFNDLLNDSTFQNTIHKI